MTFHPSTCTPWCESFHDSISHTLQNHNTRIEVKLHCALFLPVILNEKFDQHIFLFPIHINLRNSPKTAFIIEEQHFVFFIQYTVRHEEGLIHGIEGFSNFHVPVYLKEE